MKEPNKFHVYETLLIRKVYAKNHSFYEKITPKASDATIYRVVRFFHPRSSCTTLLMLFSERPPIYASSCMTISGERTKQLDIFCRITGFRVIFVRRTCPQIYASGMTISGERTEQYVVFRFWRAGCSRLEYVDIRLIY